MLRFQHIPFKIIVRVGLVLIVLTMVSLVSWVLWKTFVDSEAVPALQTTNSVNLLQVETISNIEHFQGSQDLGPLPGSLFPTSDTGTNTSLLP